MESESSDEDPAESFIFQLILVGILTAINAFFASAELALLSANKTKIKLLAEGGNKKAQMVEKLSEDQTRFLSTIQVGITFAGFFSSATAATYISDDLGGLLINWGVSAVIAKELSIIVVTIVLSYFTLVFGELFPKRIALKRPEQTAMRSARVLIIVRVIFAPFVKLLSMSTNLLVKITGLGGGDNEKISEEEIKSVIETGVSDGTLNSGEQRMIESIFKFDNLTATDIMTPRVNVFMIDIEDSPEECFEEMLTEQYSRIPVYEETRDNIIGILMFKDLLAAEYANDETPLCLRSLMRKPYFVTDKIKIDELFTRMQKSHNQIAILTDEFGGFSGIVTMEDLIEEIVGNIYDEYDDEPDPIIMESENVYIVDGLTPVQDINRELGTDFDENNEGYDTLNGLITVLLGHLPEKNEQAQLELNNVKFEILSAERNRAVKVKITLTPQDIVS
ncbi:MAG: hemolysin family protein [Clostridia bacterium]